MGMEFQAPAQGYFHYLKEVLGVSSLISAREPEELVHELQDQVTTQTGHLPEKITVPLLVLDAQRNEPHLFSAEVSELWSKMKQAMKLDKDDILELRHLQGDLDSVLVKLQEAYAPRVVLLLQEEPRRGVSRTLGQSQIIESFHPSLLLEQTQLKKMAWEDLQLVMHRLSESKSEN